jgi:hypothetical protein
MAGSATSGGVWGVYVEEIHKAGWLAWWDGGIGWMEYIRDVCPASIDFYSSLFTFSPFVVGLLSPVDSQTSEWLWQKQLCVEMG